MTGQKSPTIVLIVAALLPELGIGYRGRLPWRLRQELSYFRKVTTHTKNPDHVNAVIMGRKTWDSIPARFRPLPDRINVVISRSFSKEIRENENLILSNDLDDALQKVSKVLPTVEKLFVIGGSTLYSEFCKRSLTKHMLLTEIRTKHDVEIDTWLDIPIGEGEWKKQPHEAFQKFTGLDFEDTEIQEGDFGYRFTYWTKE